MVPDVRPRHRTGCDHAALPQAAQRALRRSKKVFLTQISKAMHAKHADKPKSGSRQRSQNNPIEPGKPHCRGHPQSDLRASASIAF
jgi:hypothetical protein